MPTLQIRDIPQHIYDELVAQAKAERRSLTQQALYILEQNLLFESKAFNRKKEVLDRIRNSGKDWSHLPDPEDMIREDRNR